MRSGSDRRARRELRRSFNEARNTTEEWLIESKLEEIDERRLLRCNAMLAAQLATVAVVFGWYLFEYFTP